jgi:hypothetical protein
MPVIPALPLLPTHGAAAHPHPSPPGTFAVLPHATTQGVRAQTAKAVKHTGHTADSGGTRGGTETDESLDEEANTLDAKSKRRPGSHILDVEA